MIDRINSLGTSTVIAGNQRVSGESESVEKEKKSTQEPVVDEVSARLVAQFPTSGSPITTVEEAWSAVEKIKETIAENKNAAIGAQGKFLAEESLARMGLS